jgi:hypothetical protein
VRGDPIKAEGRDKKDTHLGKGTPVNLRSSHSNFGDPPFLYSPYFGDTQTRFLRYSPHSIYIHYILENLSQLALTVIKYMVLKTRWIDQKLSEPIFQIHDI